MYSREELAKEFLTHIEIYSELLLRRPLYRYQLKVAHAIVRSVLFKRGYEFAIMFPRQSGKNEVQSHLQAYLLSVYFRKPGAQIVIASPTFKPQAINALMRLEHQLSNEWTGAHWARLQGYIIQVVNSLALFFSAEPSANTVGATASLALFGDEAQDIQEDVWAKRFEPMTASTNATTALFGTAWTSNTLLAKTIARLREKEKQDGVQRVFVVHPDDVAKENPAYGEFVQKQIEKYGRNHPFVKTQLFNETIDAEGGMFPPPRRAMLQGDHAPLTAPVPGELYAFTLDVAGEDEAATGDIGQAEALANPKRDATNLRIARVRPAQGRRPTYETVALHTWIGVKHTAIHAQIAALARLWKPTYIVADATGVGAGLVSFLTPLFGDRVIPFTFTTQSKSQLGWDCLALADTGRCLMYAEPLTLHAQPSTLHDPHSTTWQEQLEFCQYEIIPGPARLMRWGVPDGTRNPATGLTVHDDYLITAALLSVLDEMPWIVSTGPGVIAYRAPDPLKDIDRGF